MTDRLPTRTLLSYAAPGIPMALFIPPFPAILAAFYAQHTAATAAGIGTAMLVSRVFDAFTDPPMGYLSDKTSGRFGRRKPWILLGGLVGMLALAVCFAPPTDAGNFYFLAGLLLYYLAKTIINIPLRAWSAELTAEYGERSRIALYLTTSLLIGGLIFFIMPPVLTELGWLSSSEFNHETMRWLGWTAVALLPVSLIIAVTLTPVGRDTPANQASIRDSLKAVRENKPFWVLMSAESLNYVSSGITYSVLILALSNYWGFGPQMPMFLLVLTLVQLLAMAPTGWLAQRLGKHRTWAYGVIGQAIILPGVFLMPPGETPFLLMVAFGSAHAILQAPHMMMPMAMLTDTADYDKMKTGQERAANYFAVQHLIFKGMNAVGYSLGYLLIAAVGYDPKITDNTAFSELGMLIVIGAIPPVLLVSCGGVLLKYPLTKERHAIIQRRIARREQRNLGRA